MQEKSVIEKPDVTSTDTESDDSVVDPDFVDSDNEVDKGDDDLFEKFVDADVQGETLLVQDQGSGNGKSVEEMLQLPESSDDEGGIKLKFKCFSPDVDMENPKFLVGMVFGSASEVRKAIKQYSIKNSVAINIPRNNKKRIEAYCVEGCPLNLTATEDSRANCFMIKKYVDKHTCKREWELKAVTVQYLADRYTDKFRDDDKMTLKSFARVVQKDLHVTPSRHKLGRARRLAMKAIYGDEVAQYDQLWDYGQEVRRSNPGSKFF